MNNISWRAIRAFIFVAEYGSFTAAAEAANLSKANLSQQVTDLEAGLGVQLLYRTTRSLRLTEIGSGYYQRCKHVMRDIDAATEWATQSKDELKGVIRMNSVGGPIGEELIAPLVIEFQSQHPGVEVHLDFSSIHVDLIEDQYDLVVRMGELPDSSLIKRKLHSVTTRYVASPAFLEQYNAIKEPEDLRKVPLISGSVDQWIFTRGKSRRIVQVAGGIKVASGRVMRQAALAGLGVTRTADVYIQADITSGKLVEILPEWTTTSSLSLVCPPMRYHLGRVSALMDWLKIRFKTGYQQALKEGFSATD